MSRSAPDQRIPVGVVVERRKATSPWIDVVWRAVAVLPGAPDTAPWTQLDGDATAMRFFLDTAEVALFRGDTARYRDNLASGAPALWVVLRPTDAEPPLTLALVTADPSEGEARTEAGGDLVEAVAMPPSVAEAIASFVAEHHVEQAFFKRQRDRGNPEALARRSRKDESE
ncbi:MAG: DUF3305 domain-containing protein [Alphaproteobacteria bacterium]|nr:DUF3305 domain-containing protein [Alphaproteobacteria bacterium]